MLARIYAVAAAFTLALTFLAVPRSARGESPSGAVYVTTLPSGADIWLDGTYIGRAPVFVDALAPGSHALTITKTGWVTTRVDVSVAAGGTTMSSTHLDAGPRALAGDAIGSVVVRDAPAGASLELDGAPITAENGRELPAAAGKHHITALVAHAKFTREFTVLPGTVTEVVLRAPQADARSLVVAPAEDYLPTDNFTLEGRKVVVRYAGHTVVAFLGAQQERFDGVTVSYDAAPQLIGNKLYLPIELLEKLTGDTSN